MQKPPRLHEPVLIHIPKTAGTSVATALQIEDSHKSAANRRAYHPDWDGTPTFSIVRNPWDHAVSWYFFGNNTHVSFHDWVMHLDEDCSNVAGVHPLDQLKYICDGSGKIIVGRVFRFENLFTDGWGIIKRWLGYPEALELPHKNRLSKAKAESRRPWWTYYTMETAAVIARRQKSLISRFGYRWP
jgi:hypothetical protein